MATPRELIEPDLRGRWNDAKKAAEMQAKGKKGQDNIYAPIKKQFSQDLGPQLKKWPSDYPNVGAMETKLGPIKRVITQYRKVVVAEKQLNSQIKTTLTTALDEISGQLDERLEKARELILGDEDLALKQAIKESKKLIPVIEVLAFPDISPLIRAKAPDVKALNLNAFSLQVLLTDDEVLGKIDPNDGNARLRVTEAANVKKIVSDLAAVYSKLDTIVAADPSKFAVAETKFGEAVDRVIQEATGRASDEFHRLVGVKAQYRNYKIKTGIKLTLAISGTFAGGVSLALAPFAPVMIFNAVGVIKGAVDIGEEIGKLSLSAEETARTLRRDVDGLVDRYKGWPGFDVGSIEVTVTLVNAISPTFFKTISSCSDDLGRLDNKIAGLEVEAGKLSTCLNLIIDEQKKFDTYLAGWIKQSKAGITPKIKFAVVALRTQMNASREAVEKMIEKITELNGRVNNARKDQKDLASKISALSAKEPTIAKFAEVFINTSANVGFLVSANVGWEDAYKIVESTKAVSDTIGNVSGSLDGAKSLAKDLKGLVDEARGK